MPHKMSFPVALCAFGMACETAPSGPAGAAAVNADIEQRIESRVLEGRSTGAPDLRRVPDAPPPLPAPSAVDAERQSLVAEARGAVEEIGESRAAASRDEDVMARAAALKRQIERDRALAAEEGSLADSGLVPRQ